MKISNPKYQKFWLCLILMTILTGILFRFVSANQRPFWYDEAFTLMHISGYTRPEYIQEFFDGDEVTVADLQTFQHLTPERPWHSVVSALATTDSQHPPLYYIATRVWAQLWDTSLPAMRVFSSLISLLSFPLLFLLCQELERSPLFTWITIALFSISPFQIFYAQEVREYSLWTVTILWSSLVLVKTVRNPRLAGWSWYGLSLVISLYSSLFALFIMISHGAYIACITKMRRSKLLLGYLSSSMAALVAFSPWILVLILQSQQLQETTSLGKSSFDIGTAQKWFIDLHYNFLDLKGDAQLAVLSFLLVAYSFYFVYCHAKVNTKWFILSLSVTTFMILATLDIVKPSGISTRSRYLIVSYLGTELAISYLLSHQIWARRYWTRQFWTVITVGLMLGGILSNTLNAKSEVWLYRNSPHLEAIRIVQQSSNTLLISGTNDLNPIEILAMSHILPADLRLQLASDAALKTILGSFPVNPDRFDQIFVFNPSEKMRNRLEQNYQLIAQDQNQKLWKLTTNSG